MRRKNLVALALVWPLFTVATPADAQQPHLFQRGEDVDETAGVALRVGTVAGFAEFRQQRVTAVGASLAGAYWLGPFTLEGTYDVARLGDFRDNSPRAPRGTLHRLGLVGRLNLLRAGSVILFAEGGMGRQMATWVDGESFARNDAVVGFGWMLDHRFEPRRWFLSRVGWHFGWRITAARAGGVASSSLALCESGQCRRGPVDKVSPADFGLFVTSGLTFTW